MLGFWKRNQNPAVRCFTSQHHSTSGSPNLERQVIRYRRPDFLAATLFGATYALFCFSLAFGVELARTLSAFEVSTSDSSYASRNENEEESDQAQTSLHFDVLGRKIGCQRQESEPDANGGPGCLIIELDTGT